LAALSHDVPRGAVTTAIGRLIDNLVNLKDETGEFLLRLDDGRIIDTKGWNDWEWTHGIGLFGLYRYSMGPKPGGPAPHFHRSLTESFFVLDGRVSIYDGRDWLDTGPGDWVHVPIGGVHGFRNESGPASMLLHFSPGAPREEYFEQVAAAADLPPEERLEFFLRHDNHFL